MVITTAVATRGSYHTDAEVNQVEKATGAGTDFAIGLVVALDVADDKFKTATTALNSPFGVVVNRRPATTATKMDVTLSGHVIVEADGAIAPGNFVMIAATAGTVTEFTGTDLRKLVGRYIGKANGNERDGVTQTAAADGDMIWVKLGLGGGGF
jgi:hypothetical protein